MYLQYNYIVNMETNIKDVIENWYSYKQQHDDLEKRIDRCKDIVKQYMDDKDINILISNNHVVKRSRHFRDTLNKKDIPDDIWQRYQKKSEYWLYKITEK